MKIKLRVGGSYWEVKANQILNDIEIENKIKKSEQKGEATSSRNI